MHERHLVITVPPYDTDDQATVRRLPVGPPALPPARAALRIGEHTLYSVGVAWWDKVRAGERKDRSDGPGMGIDLKAVRAHFRAFIASRRGVEAYVEPATSVTATTVVLVAADGEWTRRAVGSRDHAFSLSRDLDVPVYDVNLTGYPSRMREWTNRQRRGASAPAEATSADLDGFDFERFDE